MVWQQTVAYPLCLMSCTAWRVSHFQYRGNRGYRAKLSLGKEDSR